MNAAYKVLYALAVWPVALILAVIGAWWPLALVLACGLFEWLGVPERVGAWLGVIAGDVVSVGAGRAVRITGGPVVVQWHRRGKAGHAGGRLGRAWPG